MVASALDREVEFRRTVKQAEFIDSNKANFLYVGGRGAGKSYAGGMWKLKRGIAYPDAVGLIAANTYDQLNKTTLKKYCDLLRLAGIAYVFNKHPPSSWGVKSQFEDHAGVLTLPNGRQEVCVSLQNFNNIRGKEFSDAWLDETRDTDPEAINVIAGCFRGFQRIYPALVYQLRVTTTPNGFDHVWRMFADPTSGESGGYQNRLPDSGYVQASTRDNIYEPGLADRLEAQYGKQLARQEIGGEFINLALGRAFTFDRSRNVRKCEYDPTKPLYWSMDFNVAPLCGVVMQLDTRNRKAVVLDEVYIPDNAQTAEACREFVRRWKPIANANTVRLAGDASGRSRNTTTEETNHSIMSKEIRPHFKRVEEHWDSCNPSQWARIQASNALLEPSIGEVRFYVDPKCERLIHDFETASFKPGTQELDKKESLATHCVDAATYPIAREFPVLDLGPAPSSMVGKGKGFFG